MFSVVIISSVVWVEMGRNDHHDIKPISMFSYVSEGWVNVAPVG